MRTAWGEEATTKLRLLWAYGMSAAAIGRAMGVSKNAIVGRAHRLNLPRRPSPIRRAGEAPVPSVPRERPKVTLPPLAEMPLPAPPRPFARSAAIAPESATIFAPLSPRQCEWLSGNGPRDYVRCEAPVTRGSYCAGHAAVAYVPRRVREDVG